LPNAKGLLKCRGEGGVKVAKPSSLPAAEVLGLALKRSEVTLLSLVEVRQCLECQITYLAAQKVKQSHILALRQTIEQMEQNKDRLEFCVVKDIEFHDILIEASGNPVFRVMLSPLRELLKQSRCETLRSRGVNRALDGHQQILDAIVNGQPERAAVAMAEHLEMAEEDIQLISEDEDVENC
jgi:GntR family transcriptional repressor for pyruvate dehydrogenase complex